MVPQKSLEYFEVTEISTALVQFVAVILPCLVLNLYDSESVKCQQIYFLRIDKNFLMSLSNDLYNLIYYTFPSQYYQFLHYQFCYLIGQKG